MIAYDKTLLENTFLVTEAVNLKKSGFINDEDLSTIKTQLGSLKTNRNIFVRIGFLLLGFLLYLSIIGVVFLVSLGSGSNFKVVGFVIAAIGFGILELLCATNYFRHGLDDAFIIAAQVVLYSTIAFESDSPTSLFWAMIICGFICAARYVSTISFLVSLSGIVLLISYSLVTNSTVSSILPFVLLLTAIIFYVIYIESENNSTLYLYQDILQWHFIYSLFLGYLSVNYFVVRAISEDYLGADYSNNDIPFGWIFYLLMFVIPLVYIFYSLKTKNRTMLYIGCITFVLSVATFRYYHSVLPAEWELLVLGLGLFGLVYFVIQKIKTRATGITFQQDRTNDTAMLNNIEALIVNSQELQHAEQNSQSEMPFDGGDFSGGGAGGSF